MIDVSMTQIERRRSGVDVDSGFSYPVGQFATDAGSRQTTFHPMRQSQQRRVCRPFRSVGGQPSGPRPSSSGNCQSDGRRLSSPDEVQSVQRSLQDAGAFQAAEKSRRQSARRLHTDFAIVSIEHDTPAAQGFKCQHQLVAGQTAHLPQRRSSPAVGIAQSRNASLVGRYDPGDVARMAFPTPLADSQTPAGTAYGAQP